MMESGFGCASVLTAGTGRTGSLWAFHGTSASAHSDPTSGSCSPRRSEMIQSHVANMHHFLTISLCFKMTVQVTWFQSPYRFLSYYFVLPIRSKGYEINKICKQSRNCMISQKKCNLRFFKYWTESVFLLSTNDRPFQQVLCVYPEAGISFPP